MLKSIYIDFCMFNARMPDHKLRHSGVRDFSVGIALCSFGQCCLGTTYLLIELESLPDPGLITHQLLKDRRSLHRETPQSPVHLLRCRLNYSILS